MPILGTEPLPVEFANTLYDGLDCLGTPEHAAQWFAEMSLAVPDTTSARGLRDAVHRLLMATEAGKPLAPQAVATVNAHAAAAPTTLRLEGRDREWSARWVNATSGPVAVLGRIATCTIELLAGGAQVRRCGAPDCGLFFVAQHARRRFCHSSCGQRVRQARYYRRHLKDDR